MPAPRFPTPVGSRRWIATLGALTAVVALSIDISLPAQPTFVEVFGIDAETAQLTLSLFMLGFAAAQLVIGYLSDALGRRVVLFGGLGLFTVAAIACAASPSIEVLLACRVLQGAAASAPPVVARAMIRDTHPSDQAARLLSTMIAVLAIAPMIAPTIGGVVLRTLGWRAVFGVLAVFGLALIAIVHFTVTETLPPDRRRPASLRGMMSGFAQFFATPHTRLPIAISCAAFAGQFAYISDSPYVLMEGYGVGPAEYGIYFAMIAFALMLGSIGGARMLRAGRSPGAMLVIGSTVLVTGGVLVTIGTRFEALGIAGFLVPMVLYFAGAGMTSPSAAALAMEPAPQLAGTASAVIGTATMTSGAISGYATTSLGGSSPQLFAVIVLAMGCLASVLAITAARLRRRRISSA